MNWSTPADLRAQLKKLWDRGDLLRTLLAQGPPFPIRLSLKGPSSSELTQRFNEVRPWITELRSLPHVRLEMREFTHRVLGANAVPESAWVDSLDDALALLGKRREAALFQSMVNSTPLPTLLPWLAKRPMQALELAGDWERLLSVVAWMQLHPRPGIYIRQIDLPGVHTKFIEMHRPVLAELLDLALPPDSIQTGATGVAQFAARYGFREKPIRIRYRVLDPRLSPFGGFPDITLDAESFARLKLEGSRVFITENEVNFLALPPMENSLVIFGAGYGWDALAKAQWLARCPIFYWGDIDTHGFAILSQLRSHFPRVDSFLMDRETLTSHESLWGEEEKPALHDLPNLTPPERAVYNDLRDNRLRKNLRMEQEQISFRQVEAALEAAPSLYSQGL